MDFLSYAIILFIFEFICLILESPFPVLKVKFLEIFVPMLVPRLPPVGGGFVFFFDAILYHVNDII
jgi:hypothetical protein